MLTLITFITANWRWAKYLVIVAAIVGVYVWWHHKIYTEGQQEALQKMEKANEEVRHRADQGSDAVALCYRGGGVWDRATGVCTDVTR